MAPIALILLSLLHIIPIFGSVSASDPDPLGDICVADLASPFLVNGPLPCKAPSSITPSDFTSRLLRNSTQLVPGLGVAVNLVNAERFPGLNTQGLSISRIDFQPNGLNPPHVHPRSSEVFYVVDGTLSVAFVSTDNNYTLYEQTIYKGDVVVFPRGLVHYQINVDGTKSARAIAAFNSQNPGREDVAVTLFGAASRVPTNVLQKALGGVSEALVEELIAKVPPPA